MPSTILVAGDTEAESSTVTLTDGATANLGIAQAAGNDALLWVEAHVAGSEAASPPTDEWAVLGRLTPGLGSAVMVVIGPGSFRLRRKSGVSCVGVRL